MSNNELVITAILDDKGLTQGFKTLAYNATALYQSFEGIQRAAYMVDKAHLSLQRSTESLDQAQKDYNMSVAKYGVNSVQAQDALDKLRIAQDAYSLAQEKMKLTQDRFNDSILNTAIQILPKLASPMGLVSLAAGGMMIAIQGITEAVQESIAKHAEFERRISELDDIFKVHETLLQQGVDTYEKLNAAVNVSSLNLPKLKDDLAYVNTQIADMAHQLQFAGTAAQRAALQLRLGPDLKALQDRKGQLESTIATEEKWTESLEQQNAVLAKTKKAQDDLAASLKPYNDALADLTKTYNVSMAASSLAFSTFANDFEAAFGAGRIQEAVDVAKLFADSFNISLNDAIRTLQDFSSQTTDSFSNLSDAAKTYLTGETQDTVQKFQDCAGDKLETLKKKVETLDIFEAIKIASGNIPTVVTAPPEMPATAAAELEKHLQIHWEAFQEGGIVREPTLAMIGEKGPEAVIPLEGGGGLGNNITINLTVQGSVDKRTAEYAASLIERRLKNVLVEPSSGSSSSTHKRIRFGS